MLKRILQKGTFWEQASTSWMTLLAVIQTIKSKYRPTVNSSTDAAREKSPKPHPC